MGSKKLTAQEYTVGWISPLEVEQTAALLMVDEEHERLPQAATDPSVYHLGSIGQHNVVIAGLPNTGNTSAATVVTHMRRSFPNLRFGILVGIGGGVPRPTDESAGGTIGLGDVVVSKPVGSHSGAVQYDRGKAEIGQFVRTGFLTPPPAALLNAAQMLAAKRAICETDPIKRHLKRINTVRPQLRRYQYPGIGQDILHSATCVPGLQGCQCDRQALATQGMCLSQNLFHRDQSKEETFIMVHRGTIASGEMVVKNGLLRDLLAQQHDVHCFETEAAGAMNDFPCLVIRGVSDYCDAHKNNIWHGYAAAVAAAYARELFFHMPINLVTPSLYINHAEELISQVCNRPVGPLVREIARWLSDLDFSIYHNEVCCRRQPGTGKWLLECTEFQTWLGLSNSLLFCSGIPGAGKTFLFSLVVDYLAEQLSSNREDVAIIYIYCDYKAQEKQRTEFLLASMVKQLLLQIQGRVPESIEKLYTKCTSGKLRPTIHELVRHCTQLISLFRVTFLLIDGLDEQDEVERRELVHYLFQFYQSATSLQIFTTSRPIPELRDEFILRGSAEVEIQATGHDISLYLNAKMHRLPGWVQKAPGLFDETVDSITRASQGMFLLVYLLFESLLHKTSLKAFKRALNDLPTGINAAYQQINQRIAKQDPERYTLARVALDWITYNARIITVSELRTAVSLEIIGEAADDEDLPDMDTIVAVCCGLIEVSHRAQTVRYVHYTAKQYFERSLNADSTNERIATACLTYLSLDVFGLGACVDDETFESRLRTYPLYWYASQQWGHHANVQTPELVERILRFLSGQKKLESSAQALLASKLYIDDTGYSQRVPKPVTPLHLVSHFGLEDVARRVSDTLSNAKFSICDSDGKSPLAWAAQRGNVKVVEYILSQEKATINVRDRTGSSVFLRAAQMGHDQVLRVLMAHASGMCDVPDYFKRSPLWHAADKGHVSVVDALLTDGTGSIDVNGQDIDGYTPLIKACANGHTCVVSRLLDSGADVNARDARYGRTALIWASVEGHDEIVNLLVRFESVEWESLDNDGRSALWWAAEERHTVVLRHLLSISNRLNTNLMDTLHQRSMLSRAAERGDAATVALLLEYESTDPNLRDNDGLVPLAWAARGGHDNVISMLLQKDEIDLNTQLIGSISSTTVMEEGNSYEFKPSLRKGQTAVSHAAEMGNRNTVEILLDCGAAIDAPDDFGKTPLMYALHKDDIAMVHLLLSRGANPNSFNRHLETPLIMAVKDRKIEIAMTLLASHGIDPSWDHKSGHSAIWWATLNNDIETLELLRQTGQVDQNIREDAALLPMAARVGNEAAVRWLIDQEGLIDPDCVSPTDGRSALCCAAFAGHSEILKLLLFTQKVDVCRKDTRGRSIISWAETGEITRILLDAGADPNDQDCDGGSPLSLAVEQRQRNKVDILLQHPRTNVNLADNAGNTPLYYASGPVNGPTRREIMAGRNVPKSSMLETTEQEAHAIAMAELLISHGASPHVVNLAGHTALFYALWFERMGLAAVLKQHGAVMSAQDEEDMAPILSLEEPIDHNVDWPDPDADMIRDPIAEIHQKLKSFMSSNEVTENEKLSTNLSHKEHEFLADLDAFGLLFPAACVLTSGDSKSSGLHEVGLPRQQLSNLLGPRQSVLGSESPLIPFSDELELADMEKRTQELSKFVIAPTLGRRFPGRDK